jgi:hypothetical protein
MSTFQQLGMIGGQAIDVNSSTKQHQLGLVCKAVDMASTDYGVGEFVYAIGSASTVVGSVCLIDEDGYQTDLAVANDKGTIGIAMAATLAGEYGWFQIKGKGVAKVLASFADNANCYLTATDGSIDDAVVAGDRIHNMLGLSAIDTPSTGLAEVSLNYPHTDDIAD